MPAVSMTHSFRTGRSSPTQVDFIRCNHADPVRPTCVFECADVCVKHTKESGGSVFTGMFWSGMRPFHYFLEIFPISFLVLFHASWLSVCVRRNVKGGALMGQECSRMHVSKVHKMQLCVRLMV